jgi:putative oxidoreductase
MKKYIPIAAGIILGLLFIMSGMIVLLNMAPTPKLPEGSPAALFMGAFGPTGYMTFIKVMEVIGGVLVAIPRTRNLGLLVLGPIIVNILAFHVFITNGAGLLEPMLLLIVALALYLLWVERKAFGGLVHRPVRTSDAKIS